MGFTWAPVMAVSKVLSLTVFKVAMAFIESSLPSYCMRMKPMPAAYQSVLRKTGLDESNLARRGELVNASFIDANRTVRSSVQS
jgi:hypothetical protein